MATRSHSSTSDVRGIGMRKKSKDQGHLIVANGGGVQHTEADVAGMGYTDDS